MAGFLYFWANGKPVNGDNVDELTGLGYAFAGSVASREVLSSAHPCQAAGHVIGDPNDQPAGCELGMYPDRQTWLKMPCPAGRPELWLGWWTEARPTPAALRRDVKFRTHRVRLDDGQFWEVPIVGHRDGGRLVSDLPAYLTFDEQGRRVRGAMPLEYSSLWESVAAVADKQFAHEAGEGEAVADDEQWAVTASLLAAVYRVGPIELLALDTFLDGSESLGMVWAIATAYPWLMETLAALQKKTSPATGGGEGSSPGDKG